MYIYIYVYTHTHISHLTCCYNVTLTCLHQEVGYMALPLEPIECGTGGSG